MKKDLPEVYANSFDKKIDNSQEYYYGHSSDSRETKLDYNGVLKKVDEIFHSPNYVYKVNCEITKNGIKDTKIIVGKTANSLITMNNEIINFKDIEDIKVI